MRARTLRNLGELGYDQDMIVSLKSSGAV